MSTTKTICHQAFACPRSGHEGTPCGARAFSASLRMALDVLGSCACGVDACGGPGTACAPRAMGAARSGVTAQHACTRPNGRNDRMNFATRLATLERQQTLIQA